MHADSGSTILAFAGSAIRIATPLGIAALGETITERSGVINIGIEGAMLCGALGSALGAHATGSVAVGFLAGAVAGLLASALFGWFTVLLRTDQIVVGTAITLGATGLTGALYRAAFGTTGTALNLPSIGSVIPAGFLFVSAPLLWFTLTRTQWGLALRAAGESPGAALAAGIPVRGVRMAATLFGGVMAGGAGATLVLAQAGTFAEGITAGRGFIAIAIVVLGRWNPLGVLAAALLFGAASALQFAFQAAGIAVPYQFFLMLPYAVSLLALAGVFGRAQAPEALGQP
ncbi:MAG TPA: ABC transporter permease [Gemmatimonadales bacterium]|jgi:simple sugar transport system permease protein